MWYYARDSQRLGPVTDDELRALIANGTVVRQTPVWKEGMQDWVQAGKTELAACFSSVPPTPPSYTGLTTYSRNAATYDPRSFRTLWLWFAWLVGAGLPLCAIVIGLVPLIAGVVISYILLYRYWEIIQDGKARTSPGKAVGFCFIPFFNFYWFFVAIVGLAKDMNTYCDERNIAGPRVSDELALAWFILILCGIIPYVGIVTAIAGIVIWIILYKQFSDTAARIMEMKKRLSEAKSGAIEFDGNGKVTRVDMQGGRWEEKRSGQNHYFTQRGRSLLHATEILKAVPSIPGQTYYAVETPDGTLGRDMLDFYTEAPLKTSGLRLETSAPVLGPVESVSLIAFGNGDPRIIAEMKSAGQYAAFVLLLECGHCGYKSPVETKAGDLERQCYACGATNKSHRAAINVFLGSKMVQI